MKLVFSRSAFISRFCVFALHHNGSGVSPAEKTARLYRVIHRDRKCLSCLSLAWANRERTYGSRPGRHENLNGLMTVVEDGNLIRINDA